MPSRLDQVRRQLESGQPLMPITALLGMSLRSVGQGEAVIEYEAAERHANAMGTLHGGVLCAMADTAMGVAFYTALGEDESLTTLELKINYLKPVWRGKLTASARVVKRGKTVGLLECDITDREGQLIARASSTFMAITGEQAANRSAPRHPS